MSKRIPLFVGEVYGDLTIVEELPKNSYKCQCICGNEKVVFGSRLRLKNTQSCGCRWRKAISEEAKGRMGRRFFQKEKRSAAHKLFRYYQRTAPKRGFAFELNFEMFKILTSSPCIYCGAPPSKICKAGGGDRYTYNGVDRYKNSFGYVKENSVPCCWRCNKLKFNNNGDDFLKHVSEISKWQDQKRPSILSQT